MKAKTVEMGVGEMMPDTRFMVSLSSLEAVGHVGHYETS